jgi:flavodoxin
MRSLVVYFSRTGNTAKVAEAAAAQLSSDIEKLEAVKDHSGFFGWFLAGKEATRAMLTPIKDIKKDPASYDLVVIGTPIWSWNVSSPVRTYLSNCKGKFKKVAFFCTEGGSGSKRAFRSMEEACGKGPVAALALRQGEVGAEQAAKKIGQFVADLKRSS